jgi:hypothetical protein
LILGMAFILAAWFIYFFFFRNLLYKKGNGKKKP